VIEPAHLWIPPRVGSYGDEAVDLAEMAGRTLDEEQRLAVDAMLSYGPGGRWVALESAIVESRQNGKTAGVILPVVLFDLFLLPPDRIVWTAHLFRTARDSFEDVCACIATAPELSRRVKRIDAGHGDEAIHLHNGAKLEFLARSRGGGRGLGGKRIVMDEALILSAASIGALLPTLSAREDPQVTYGSSASMETSDQLQRLAARGRSGADPSLIWVEWCAPGSWDNPPCDKGRSCPHLPGTAGCALDDEANWQKANHTLGKRITVEFVRSERRSMPPLEFGRERLGWHEAEAGAYGQIDMAAWTRLQDPTSERAGFVALGVDISPHRDYAAIAAYAIRADGLGHMQLVDYRPGTDWIIPRMLELHGALDVVGWAMGRGTWASLEAELEKHDIGRPKKLDDPWRGDVAVVAGADMSAACGQLIDGVRQEDFRVKPHEQYPEVLTAAAAAGRARETVDAIAWSRKDSGVDISPLMAATLARWLYQSWSHLVAEYDALESVY
jgi:hypothetical protein